MNLFAKQKQRRKCREEIYGLTKGAKTEDELRDWDWNVYIAMHGVDT